MENVLKEGTLLKLYDLADEEFTFQIKNFLGSGGSADTYEAALNAQIGTLKKFKHNGNEPRLIRYVDSFTNLTKSLVTRANLYSNTFNFLPEFYFYRAENYDLYVWSPEAPVYTYDRILYDYSDNSIETFITLMKCIESLTEAAGDLSYCGFVHRDIKPGNFGFASSYNGNIKEQMIKFIDVDSIVHSEEEITVSISSGIFTEPNFRNKRPDYLTDIYSIGMTLLWTIAPVPPTEITDNLIVKLLHDSPRFSQIDDDLYHIQKDFFAILATALRINENLYYSSFNNFLADITSLRRSLELIANNVDYETYIDSKTNNWRCVDLFGKNKTLSFSYLNNFYTDPLYEGSNNNSINALCIGSDMYTSRALDFILQLGQGYNLNVDIASYNVIEYFNAYLVNRPSLIKFFEINNNTSALYDSTYGYYGNISTKPMTISGQLNLETLKLSLEKLFDGASYPNYIHVSFGNDDINRTIAFMLKDILQDKTHNHVTIKYVVEAASDRGLYIDESTDKFKISPIFVNKNINNINQLERMAFNVHSTWSNQPLSEKTFEFYDPYNYASSLINAVSIKYKLNKCGIDIDYLNYASLSSQAPEYIKLVTELNKDSVYNALAYIEHARWCVEKAVSGFLTGDVEKANEVKSTHYTNYDGVPCHICLVPGDESNRLTSDDICQFCGDINQYDELDRVSILYNGNTNFKDVDKDLIVNIPNILSDYEEYIDMKLFIKGIDQKMFEKMVGYAYNTYTVDSGNNASSSLCNTDMYELLMYSKNLLNIISMMQVNLNDSMSMDNVNFKIIENSNTADSSSVSNSLDNRSSFDEVSNTGTFDRESVLEDINSHNISQLLATYKSIDFNNLDSFNDEDLDIICNICKELRTRAGMNEQVWKTYKKNLDECKFILALRHIDNMFSGKLRRIKNGNPLEYFKI